jgi:hypothetical protein
LIGVDKLANPLMADTNSLLIGEPIGGLLGTQVLTPQRSY